MIGHDVVECRLTLEKAIAVDGISSLKGPKDRVNLATATFKDGHNFC